MVARIARRHHAGEKFAPWTRPLLVKKRGQGSQGPSPRTEEAPHGLLRAGTGPAIDGQEPKYRFPVGFRKSLILFNLHRAIATTTTTVVVVEGFFDPIAVHQAGHPMVALMGSSLSRCQAELLTSHFDRSMLMLDGDERRQSTSAIANILSPRMPITLIAVQLWRTTRPVDVGRDTAFG
jgi:hypothetical protein